VLSLDLEENENDSFIIIHVHVQYIDMYHVSPKFVLFLKWLSVHTVVLERLHVLHTHSLPLESQNYNLIIILCEDLHESEVHRLQR
jgi:hypothetical protein